MSSGYAKKRGGWHKRSPFLTQMRFFCKFNMRAARKQGLQALPIKCPVWGCGWQWQHNMRRHYEEHDPHHQLTNERMAQWDWGPEGIIVLGEGEAAFWAVMHDTSRS